MPQAPGAPSYPPQGRARPQVTPGRRAPCPRHPPRPSRFAPVPRASGQIPASLTPGLTRLRQLLLGFQPQLYSRLCPPRAPGSSYWPSGCGSATNRPWNPEVEGAGRVGEGRQKLLEGAMGGLLKSLLGGGLGDGDTDS
ncbi:hypothetical protein NN561_006079 [Cricetulus griseus]